MAAVLLFVYSILNISVLSVTARQRPLMPNHPHVRSLLAAGDAAGGLLLFLRRAGSDRTASVELGSAAIVEDLYQAAADAYGVRLGSVELTFQGEALQDMRMALADSGITQEATIQVDIKRDDVFDFLALFDEQSLAAYFPNDEQLRRIRRMNEEAMQDKDADIGRVVDEIDTILRSSDSGVRSEVDPSTGRRRITSMALYNIEGDLKWRYLPEMTDFVTMAGRMTSIDLSDIECEHLTKLFIMNSWLRDLHLAGIEKCVKLEQVAVTNNPQLALITNLEALAQCPSLKEVALSGNNLHDLDVSALTQKGIKVVLGRN